jgi:hypothetical protein
LIGSGMLDMPLDQHCEVAAMLIGDPGAGITMDKMTGDFAADPDDALAKWGYVLNGHTRRYLWERYTSLPVPTALRLMVYAAADLEAATRGYRAVDSLFCGIADSVGQLWCLCGDFHGRRSPSSSSVFAPQNVTMQPSGGA